MAQISGVPALRKKKEFHVLIQQWKLWKFYSIRKAECGNRTAKEQTKQKTDFMF